MAETDRHQALAKGKQAINALAQELAWGVDVPLGRIDWQPDPELEQGEPVAEYLVTLVGETHEVQDRFAAGLVETFRDGHENAIKEQLERLVQELSRAKSHGEPS